MPDLPEKEILNKLFDEKEKFIVTETELEPKIDKEVEPLVHKIESDPQLRKPIVDDYGQTLVSSPAPAQPTIVLPLNKNQFVLGLTQKVTDSIRWLAEWCNRLIKIFGNRITFHEEKAK